MEENKQKKAMDALQKMMGAMDEDSNEQIIDMSDVSKEAYQQWCKGINDWREMKEPFLISPTRIINNREHEALSEGYTEGLILGGIACILGGIIGYILDKLNNK